MDVSVYESGNGGDLVKNAKDIKVIYGFENFPYLAMFGGNIKASTPTKRIASEQAYDFWGNTLFLQSNPAAQFNSETERALSDNPLTSSGRLQIESAIKKDLDFMKSFAIIKVATKIYSTDVLIIGISIRQPDNIQQKDFIFIWNATKLELYDKESGGGVLPPELSNIFDYTFDFTFN